MGESTTDGSRRPFTSPNSGKRAARYVLVVVALLLVAGAVTLGIAWKRPAGGSPAGSAPPSASQAVQVKRSDITPVITLDATMSARPTYVATTMASGVVSPGPGKPGELVKAGTWLYSVGDQHVNVESDCIIGQWLTHGAPAPVGLPVVSCTYPGFGLSAQIPAAGAYTVLSGVLRGKGQINDGPGPFDCPILSAPLGGDKQPGVTVVCAVPSDVRGMVGVGALLAVHSTLMKNALVLPRSTVQGSADSGVVGLLVNGHVESHPVKLGVTDGNIVQILSGLSEGDQVTSTPPALDRL